MKNNSRDRSGRYLYAITDAVAYPSCGNIGIDGATVYPVSQGPVVALVSDIMEKRIRPERKNLVAHHGVVKRLMEETTVLPVAFGTIADSPKAVLEILKENGDAFVEQLDRVRGKVEMGLRVTWDVPNIFEYFVNRYPELAELRDSVLGRRRGPSQEDKIELGRLFERLLAQDRERHTEAVTNVLSPHCADMKENQPREEREVMHLACLVERHAKKGFEDGVFEAAKLFDNSFAFDFNGPWAPHHFVSVALEA
ncbi:MAG: GvpL/GvpF family gas vesicle protein [Betaproteobacteria bacterium]|nr:GvpL/GvpF family gas vesicle protein [Betaproteobacteria bacterium]